ncbi:hypothetical protein R1sor_001293 [Riccia sorocarpa]|uniref:DUF4283 domain-containing protein n=1 Tax=Riccia sorocarpa TaxID=122646 RepID=A0ABD3GX70_9MARC
MVGLWVPLVGANGVRAENPMGFQAWRSFRAREFGGANENHQSGGYEWGTEADKEEGGDKEDGKELDWSAGVTWLMMEAELEELHVLKGEQTEGDGITRFFELDIGMAAAKLGKFCWLAVVLQTLESTPSWDRVIAWARETMEMGHKNAIGQVKVLASQEFMIVFCNKEDKQEVMDKPPQFLEGKVIRLVEWSSRQTAKVPAYLKAAWVELRGVVPFLEDQAVGMLEAIGPVVHHSLDKFTGMRFLNTTVEIAGNVVKDPDEDGFVKVKSRRLRHRRIVSLDSEAGHEGTNLFKILGPESDGRAESDGTGDNKEKKIDNMLVPKVIELTGGAQKKPEDGVKEVSMEGGGGPTEEVVRENRMDVVIEEEEQPADLGEARAVDVEGMVEDSLRMKEVTERSWEPEVQCKVVVGSYEEQVARPDGGYDGPTSALGRRGRALKKKREKVSDVLSRRAKENSPYARSEDRVIKAGRNSVMVESPGALEMMDHNNRDMNDMQVCETWWGSEEPQCRRIRDEGLNQVRAVKNWSNRAVGDAQVVGIHELKVANWSTDRWLSDIRKRWTVIFDKPVGTKGGTALIIQESLHVINSGIGGNGRIAWAKVQMGDEQVGFMPLYAPNKRRLRAAFWERIRSMIGNEKWVLVGAFNQVKVPEDVRGEMGAGAFDALEITEGEVTTDPEEILEGIQEFYQTLYASEEESAVRKEARDAVIGVM